MENVQKPRWSFVMTVMIWSVRATMNPMTHEGALPTIIKCCSDIYPISPDLVSQKRYPLVEKYCMWALVQTLNCCDWLWTSGAFELPAKTRHSFTIFIVFVNRNYHLTFGRWWVRFFRCRWTRWCSFEPLPYVHFTGFLTEKIWIPRAACMHNTTQLYVACPLCYMKTNPTCCVVAYQCPFYYCIKLWIHLKMYIFIIITKNIKRTYI